MENNKKHIFLTGNIQTGKSTIIKAVLDEVKCENTGGFFTRWVTDPKTSRTGLYIFPGDNKSVSAYWYIDTDRSIAESSSLSDESLIATFDAVDYKNKVINNEVFDKLGKKYLKQAQKSDLVVMDEIGIFEDKSYAFKDELVNLLDAGPVILGVVRNKQGLITDIIKNHPKVDVIEVTKANRDEIKKLLIKKFS